MGTFYYDIVRNYTEDDYESFSWAENTPLPDPQSIGWLAPSGKQFKEWNLDSYGTGRSYSIGSSPTFEPGLVCYAIWEDIVITEYKTDNVELGTIANAIRAKRGTFASLVYPTGFVSAIEAIIGDADPTDFIENHDTWTSYENSSATKIAAGTFYYCSGLTTVSFPMCKTISSHAFYCCFSLTTVSFPVCTTIGDGAFSMCSGLTTVSFPMCKTISSNAFTKCYSLTTMSFPVCTTIDANAFSMCSGLTTVSFPMCKTINGGAFYYCRGLTTASFPVCTTIGVKAFSLCYNLISLYLTGSSFVTLSNSNAFSSTPIAGYTTSTGGVYGSIYVPASMLASYKTRTNWTYFSSRMVGI